jgi:hypothetical protein
LPQAPQFETLPVRLSSQPLVAPPSQLPQPLLQAPSPQRPEVHTAAAFA